MKEAVTGFKVAYGPSLHSATGAYIFEEAKTEKEARKMFRETIQQTYGYIPKEFKTICYVLPLSELTEPY